MFSGFFFLMFFFLSFLLIDCPCCLLIFCGGAIWVFCLTHLFVYFTIEFYIFVYFFTRVTATISLPGLEFPCVFLVKEVSWWWIPLVLACLGKTIYLSFVRDNFSGHSYPCVVVFFFSLYPPVPYCTVFAEKTTVILTEAPL